MKVLVCGDRNWTDVELIEKWLLALAVSVNEERPSEKFVVVHGAARGADSIAGEVAAKHSMPWVSYPADWSRYGKAAGPMRNHQMLTEGQPDLVLAFHDDLARSRGTADMVRRAEVAGVPVKVIRHD